MKKELINIRDPFILFEDGVYYMYGTRAENFGRKTGGFDVYTSRDLCEWSEPSLCFDSEKYGMNTDVNWAPEVHKYRGAYYMLATFTRGDSDLRGSFILKAEHPLGPFAPYGEGLLTPKAWECIDGTLYFDRAGRPYIVFSHEHTQIIDGTIAYAPLKDDLSSLAGEPVTLFSASSPFFADKLPPDVHRVTDGPFLYRTESGELFMIWSTFIGGKYAECIVKFTDGEIGENFAHLPPLMADDAGHGMIFRAGEKLFISMHSPNKSGSEHPAFIEIEEKDGALALK